MALVFLLAIIGSLSNEMWYCSIYPPRPCIREVTELRTAYPHHGNLTPPRISPSRFREYHYHPGCHRLHEKLSHGLWSGFSLLPPLPTRGWRIMAYLTSGYHQDWCLSAWLFSFQCSAERFVKTPLLYMKWERPFWKVFLPQIEKLVLLSRYADRKRRFWRAFVILIIRSSTASVYFPVAIRKFLSSIKAFKRSLFSSVVRYTWNLGVLIQINLQIFTVTPYINRTTQECNYAIWDTYTPKISLFGADDEYER